MTTQHADQQERLERRIAALEAENTHTDAATAHLEPLRQQIFDEIKARTLETDLSVPVRRGGCYSSPPSSALAYPLQSPSDRSSGWAARRRSSRSVS